MPSGSSRLIRRWLLGTLVGTLLVAISSPLFVRSYTPLTIDEARGVWTLTPATDYRWRSEGYATTKIGPLGMPGRTSMDVGDVKVRIALWGDSQAEGVCVADRHKLFAQIEQLSGDEHAVFPLARSGEDASVWLTQMPPIEESLKVDAHVMLIVDLPDLLPAVEAPLAPPDQSTQRSRIAIAKLFPAFMIQAVRHLTEKEGQKRRLRFSLGPVAGPQDSLGPGMTELQVTGPQVTGPPAATDWKLPIEAVAESTTRPVWIVYAPPAPIVIDGKVQSDSRSDEFVAMRSAAVEAGIHVIDLSRDFENSVREGVWPHGFHNGQIGVGHLNQDGYWLIAKRLVESFRRFDWQR